MIKTAETYHVPVLLKESVDGLNIQPGGIYVDVTFGGGGHSRDSVAPDGGSAPVQFRPGCRCRAQRGGKRELHLRMLQLQIPENWMRYYGVDGLDGLLADLGVSSHHFDDETRGFSFRFDSPLDMRMNKRAGKTAADIVNEYDEGALADIFYLYGELKNSRRIASALVKARTEKPILTTKDFMAAVEPLFKREREKKDMAKTLPGAAHRSEPRDGRPERDAPLSHGTSETGRPTQRHHLSLAGRQNRKEHDESGQCRRQDRAGLLRKNRNPFKLVNNKVIVPDADEQERNPRSRSAKLRIAEKK